MKWDTATCWQSKFQSTLSVRRATDTQTTAMRAILISIHALRKESDRIGTLKADTVQFQSTLSVRRATLF